jgi:hypothetical protein
VSFREEDDSMNEFIGGVVIGAVVGGTIALVMLALALLLKPKPCAECGAPAPRFRNPANRRQMLWGGWTCPECGCEMDGRGRKVGDEQ